MKKWEEILFEVCVFLTIGMLVIGCLNKLYSDFESWYSFIVWAILLKPIEILTRCVSKYLKNN
jgi:hypothetical protein